MSKEIVVFNVTINPDLSLSIMDKYGKFTPFFFEADEEISATNEKVKQLSQLLDEGKDGDESMARSLNSFKEWRFVGITNLAFGYDPETKKYHIALPDGEKHEDGPS